MERTGLNGLVYELNGLVYDRIKWPCLVDYMKRTGLNGLVYDFSVDCDATDIDDIKDIPKYLMKKNDIVKYVRV